MGHCDWANINELERAYHDHEWGVPVHDDRLMFEHFSMECLQCGLSWDLMLKKREIFRQCFAGFDYDLVAAFCEADVERILATEGMLRSRRKVEAIINNARCYQAVREEFGSFCDYLWAYTGGKTIVYEGHADKDIVVTNGLAERIAKDLKQRGFKFVGPVTVYSHLEACGLINDHASDCPQFEQINEAWPTVVLEPDNDR